MRFVDLLLEFDAAMDWPDELLLADHEPAAGEQLAWTPAAAD